MSVLIIQLVSPMQSWGSRSRFQERDTEREPTKSGVIGLICAALGRDRRDSIDDLVLLRMGVRVDREGTIKKDFQTAQQVIKADGSKPDTQISSRAYLEDAAFLVGLEGDRFLLQTIADHLKNPAWPIFLGRKAFVPLLPILPKKDPEEYLVDDSLDAVLANYPLVIPYSKRLDENRDALRLVLESKPGESGERRKDVPVSFDFDKRSFQSRYVSVSWIPVPGGKEE